MRTPINDYDKILFALMQSGVEGLAAGQYLPEPDFHEEGFPVECVSPTYGCLLWAIYGKAHGETKSYIARMRAPGALLLDDSDTLDAAESANDTHNGGPGAKDHDDNSDAGCRERLEYMKAWLKERCA